MLVEKVLEAYKKLAHVRRVTARVGSLDVVNDHMPDLLDAVVLFQQEFRKTCRHNHRQMLMLSDGEHLSLVQAT